MRVQLLSAFRAESGTMHISKFGCLTLPNPGALSEVDTRIDTDRRRQRQGRIFQIPGSSSQGGSSFDSISMGDLPIIERTGFFTGPNLPLNEPTSNRTIGRNPSGTRRQRLRKSFTAASDVFDCAVKVNASPLSRSISGSSMQVDQGSSGSSPNLPSGHWLYSSPSEERAGARSLGKTRPIRLSGGSPLPLNFRNPPAAE